MKTNILQLIKHRPPNSDSFLFLFHENPSANETEILIGKRGVLMRKVIGA